MIRIRHKRFLKEAGDKFYQNLKSCCFTSTECFISPLPAIICRMIQKSRNPMTLLHDLFWNLLNNNSNTLWLQQMLKLCSMFMNTTRILLTIFADTFRSVTTVLFAIAASILVLRFLQCVWVFPVDHSFKVAPEWSQGTSPEILRATSLRRLDGRWRTPARRS
jgi:hypothetical protein